MCFTVKKHTLILAACLVSLSMSFRSLSDEACKRLLGESVVQCFVDPCRSARCIDEPDATCVSNFCGGCGRYFIDERRKVIPAVKCKLVFI